MYEKGRDVPSIDSGDPAVSTKGERLTHGWLREARQ